MQTPSYPWQPLGAIDPKTLTDSRIQLHYAIQFMAATGAALAEPQPDYSHTSLAWNPKFQGFVTLIVPAPTPFRVGLEPVSLTSVLLDEQGQTIAALPLPQKTLAEGFDWLRQEITRLGAEADRVQPLSYPPDDFPDHPIAHGAAFDVTDKASRQELANYYANTLEALQTLTCAEAQDISPVRLWPHHFDLALLITLPSLPDDTSRTVGLGLSPGDTSYPEPYWYVSPYPYPDTPSLPALEGKGFWHTQHWVGAVLTASQLGQNSTTQDQQLQAFLNSALSASISLL
ncbi:hypothetical protein BST81_21445 [Leptolyngbya sp. 'hensonii']|uniref:hypothetical protein n=1 Tax=Leptolyngbya sp. 'hensonii' TaxID=1922337 RepID=UPI0009500B16|nr:hypothetical protein [Leptolyngbya sp. 'hensonii']OLP16358.1 hypothetical protein BST81_21445 [Leptolyngbya sp. 'hensonii']